jgi:uncharacterized protein
VVGGALRHESVRLTGSDGVQLESRWDLPPSDPDRAVVFCHPHPLHGGTMYAPFMNGVTDHLVGLGHAVLRFNFRGTGNSGGVHTGGVDEVHDIQAAFEEASLRYPTVFLAGWSFGAATGLRWLAWAQSTVPYVGIAPAVHYAPDPAALLPGPKRIVVGEREQVIDREHLIAYAREIGADVIEVPGADHFFYFREQHVGDLIAGFLANSASTGP